MFRIDSHDPDFGPFFPAITRLIREGFISMVEPYMFVLTDEGFAYCSRHYEQLGTDEWWPNEQIDLKMQQKAISTVQRST